MLHGNEVKPPQINGLKRPLGSGPFIIMEYISHEMNLRKALNIPEIGTEGHPRFDPNVDIDKLEILYEQFADVLLELNEISLPRIGSLEQTDNSTYEVTRRPLFDSHERVGAVWDSAPFKAARKHVQFLHFLL